MRGNRDSGVPPDKNRPARAPRSRWRSGCAAPTDPSLRPLSRPEAPPPLVACPRRAAPLVRRPTAGDWPPRPPRGSELEYGAAKAPGLAPAAAAGLVYEGSRRGPASAEGCAGHPDGPGSAAVADLRRRVGRRENGPCGDVGGEGREEVGVSAASCQTDSKAATGKERRMLNFVSLSHPEGGRPWSSFVRYPARADSV